MSAPGPVGRLHVLTDEVLQDRHPHAVLARLALEGGADAVQFREKRPRNTAELVRTARAMRDAVEPLGGTLVVDDRVDVALAAGAAAVHLGPHDLDPGCARRILGPGALIGGTANSLHDALRVARLPVDYLGVGPVFGTQSKSGASPALGLDLFAAIVRAVEKPVLAIGNVTADRVGDVLAAGAHGVAVLSAVVCASDPAAAARAFRDAIDAFFTGRVHA